MTNHTGITRSGATTIDVLFKAEGVKLVSLFSPEHGIRGTLDEEVPAEKDEVTGLTIHSLYGKTVRPTDEMLQGIDTIVIDIQNIGSRFYTYETTMSYVMEEAASRKIPVFVLDRPNPINGFQIEGPTLGQDLLSFVGSFPMPIRHGMTMGELARLFNAEKKIGCDLTVVELKGWTRDQWFDETGLHMGEPVAEHAKPAPGHVVSGHWCDRGDKHLGRPWDRHAVRAGGRAVDRGCEVGGRAERAPHPRRLVLSAQLHANLEQVPRASGARGSSSSCWTGRRSGRFGSGSRSPRRSAGCTRRCTRSKPG